MSSTVPTECGKCWKCGGTLYLGLTHSCSTSVNLPAESVPFGFELALDSDGKPITTQGEGKP